MSKTAHLWKSHSQSYDLVTSSLADNHREIIRKAIVQILEDTMWITPTMMSVFLDAPFSIFDIRVDGTAISLRATSLQRLIMQSIASRSTTPIVDLRMPLLIKFKSPEVSLPRPPSTLAPSVRSDESDRMINRSGPPPNVSETELLDQVSELPGISPVPQKLRAVSTPRTAEGLHSTTDVTRGDMSVPGTESSEAAHDDNTMPQHPPQRTTTFAPGPYPSVGATFRGNPVDVDPDPGTGVRGRDYLSYDNRPVTADHSTSSRRGRLFDHTASRTPSRTPTRAHPFVDEVTLDVETFEDYMAQFQYSEVKYKDFRKVVIPTFNASKNDSFVHWYKLLTSTCLQWGMWCPPYESVHEENVYGGWWLSLPQSVRNQKAFMGNVLYSLLIKPDTFPANSRKLEAVESSSANQGYHAIYNVLRLHHPLLHSVYSTANQIPQQRRSDTFGLYLRRTQEFISRERLAARTYTESEALDLITRNVSAEWRHEFRRLVERDKRSGHGGTLPFKLTLSQIATTFVEYAAELGRDPPGSSHSTSSSSSRSSTPSAIMRRVEESTDKDNVIDAFLPDDDVELVVNVIAQNQQSSAVCVGCQLPGHTLLE